MSHSGSAEVVREETEASLIARAQVAVSRCNWEVGECAALWTKRFARGRTDADFAALVSLSADQVYQRRRVWETFGDVSSNYSTLKWSHFYAAINWDDAAECLQWADDVQAGVAEMKAWRRAQRGEDLSTPAVDEALDGLPTEPALAREAAPFDHQSTFSVSANQADEDEEASAAVPPFGNRLPEGTSEYAPFNPDATTVPPREAGERPNLSTEQIAKRFTTTIERCQNLLTPQFCEEFAELPEKVRKRLLKAVEMLAEKVSEIG
ncbi:MULTISPECIES: hypothetical protein [unclassified Schlesneria]|uniref:hypothetical protein n=1 Tax=unclassified Schlesneria TaxID=2762017 RepID=UPI002F0C5150